MRIFAAIHFQLERTKPVSKMMDDSAVSAGDQSLSGSEGGVVSDERFCTGEEHVASCARYLSQVLGIELVVVMCVCVCVCVQELQVLGLSGVVERGSRQLKVPELLNTVHRLLQIHRSDQLALEELRTRWVGVYVYVCVFECMSRYVCVYNAPHTVFREGEVMLPCNLR